MKTNHETPILGFSLYPTKQVLRGPRSSHRQNGIHFVGLLFLACNRMDAWV
jgi:hypothetical protein